MNWINNPIKPASASYREQASSRQENLTKPPGSLGELESIAIRLAALQQREQPSLDKVFISIFAADHGIAEEGVSAFPQEVTKAMLSNFIAGGAAINALAKLQGAELEIINVGVKQCDEPFEGLVQQSIAEGTANFSKQAAMSSEQLTSALEVGRQAIERIVSQHADVFIAGEMGIANTTSASALACAILKQPVNKLVGAGTGVNAEGILKKQQVIGDALAFHQSHLNEPLSILQHLGGFEIAAMVGAYIHCGQQGIPVIVDGFISSTAALIALKVQPTLADWLFYGHQSEEAGHQHVLSALAAKPLLNLNMRLGEASGAALAVSILRAACQLHTQMATFEEAGI